MSRRERFAAQLEHLVTEEADDGPDCGYSWSDGVAGRAVCRECGEPWPSEGAAFASRCASCDCPFWVYRGDSAVLEARIPELNPWAGVAVLGLHSHTAEEECDERCCVYTR